MADSTELVTKALAALSSKSGYTSRASQTQLAHLVNDLIDGDLSGLFEAPTGTGKSLACLIPAISQAALKGKRVVIATYTNVLAEQYWKKDVPFARSLFEGLLPVQPDVRLIMGRQRYCCIKELAEVDPPLRKKLLGQSQIGHETDFKKLASLPERTANALWLKVLTPVVCPARLCPDYSQCFYYSARKAASRAGVVITNHSVVIQDAIMKTAEGSEGILGEYDFLIIDEAHDFPLAAANGLEFELNATRLQTLTGIGIRIGSLLNDLAIAGNLGGFWSASVRSFEEGAAHCLKELQKVGMRLTTPGIVTASPPDLYDHSLVKSNRASLTTGDITELAETVESCCEEFSNAIDSVLARGVETAPAQADSLKESIRNYRRYLDEFASSIHALILPRGISVTHAAQGMGGAKIRSDTIGLAQPLTELLWSNVPTACLSATLAVDAGFEFYSNMIGVSPSFEEILDSPFDHGHQASVYLPPAGSIPDPGEARKNRSEPQYYQAVAKEIANIIEVCNGRTLVLFHSRREMEAVAALVPVTPGRPILVQGTHGAAEVGEQFKRVISSSLFALRSFWTGFDAPGDTLSCVVLVRIPFEVPIDPPQIARAAHLHSQGQNPFASYTLPMAKMMIRQGAGRLIRDPKDRGVIVILDPRIESKRYGEEFLSNLPDGMRTFRTIEEAAAHVELSGLQEPVAKSLFV